MSQRKKNIKIAVTVLMFMGIAGATAGLGALSVVAYQVFYGDYSSLEKTTILSRINEETSIYYLDESNRIGSLFESYHRRYSPIEEIPAHMQNAIIAAEDKNFYSHVGIDPIAIFKAVMEGVLTGGRFRRGGSTLTQQTVKNIVDDWEASFARKFREMIKALQLERMYSKKQILEFYLNQFHVAGNGNGIGIASRYYFDKDIQDLTLVEAAFIAGSVKGPGKYNPFIKFTIQQRERAIKFAFDRKNYVLKRMYEENWISKEEYEEAVNEPVPFNKGEFRTSEVALLSLVKKQLRQNEVLEALGLDNDKELNIAGLKVFTTIDKDLQEAAQLATRRNLSRLETILSGYAPEPDDKYKLLRNLTETEFYYGKVSAIKGDNPNNYELELSFGLPRGTVSNASLIRYAKLLDLPVGHPQGYKHHLKTMFESLKVGDVLFAEVKSYDTVSHTAQLELHKRPDISGGLIALDKGEVRAVVSGFETLGFNRAIQAKRQPGSVFKVPTFLGALQLGWTLLDRINNARHVFSYQGDFYYPRPDHNSPYPSTSMLWTGIMSENLASVYLAAHLIDKLSLGQFKQLLEEMELSPVSGESPRDYHYRIGRKIGVQLDTNGIRKRQLDVAVEDIQPDLIFSGETAVIKYLNALWWGDGYEDELQNLYTYDPKEYARSEIFTRMDLVRNNIVRHRKLAELLNEDWAKIEVAVKEYGAEKAMEMPELSEAFTRFNVAAKAGKPELAYNTIFPEEVPAEGIEPTEEFKLHVNPGRPLNVLDVQAIWGENGVFQINSAGISMEDVKLDGYLPLGLLVKIDQAIEAKVKEIKDSSDKYSLNQYFEHHDFRIGLSLLYLSRISSLLGVDSNLAAVLSYPLGTNVVTAAEVAKLYQSFIRGKAYAFFEKGGINQLTFIRRIEDRHGNVLYEPDVKVRQIIKEEHAQQVSEILRKIVTHGTGKRARGELYVDLSEKGKPGPKIRIPSFGKTGTTNDFTTSYFAGYMPYPVEKTDKLSLDHAYTVASYVGYDKPTMMKRGRIKVYGGTGALPLWTDFLKETIRIKDFKSYMDRFDLDLLAKKEWSLDRNGENSQSVKVDLPRGLFLSRKNSFQDEIFQLTDLQRTGENFQDEYALAKSVKSSVWVPVSADLEEGTEPREIERTFAPLTASVIKRMDEGSDNVNYEGFETPEGQNTGDESGADTGISKLPKLPGSESENAESALAPKRGETVGTVNPAFGNEAPKTDKNENEAVKEETEQESDDLW